MQAIDPICLFPSARRRVLVVENDGALASLLALLLEHAGYEVTVATDGRQADQLINRRTPPSLVLLETFLPYVGGFELLQQIRALPAWDPVRVIMLSNNAGGGDGPRARAGGADACIVKPLQPESLLALLDQPARLRRVAAEARRANA